MYIYICIGGRGCIYRAELVEVRPSVLGRSLSCCRVSLREVRLRKRLRRRKRRRKKELKKYEPRKGTEKMRAMKQRRRNGRTLRFASASLLLRLALGPVAFQPTRNVGSESKDDLRSKSEVRYGQRGVVTRFSI